MNPEQLNTEDKYVTENCKAEELITSGDLPKAAGILVSIVQKDERNWRAFNNIGILSWTRNNWHDAYAMFKQSVTIKPDYTDALINLFDAALKLKRVSEVKPYFEKALAVNPDLPDVKIILDQIIEQGSEIYICKRALQIGIYSPLVTEGQKLLEKGEYLKALEFFLKSNDTEGQNAGAFCGMGIVAYYQKKYSDAFKLFLESIKLNPVDCDTYLNLLDAAKECDQLDQAREIFEVYLKEIPELSELEPHFKDAQPSTMS